MGTWQGTRANASDHGVRIQTSPEDNFGICSFECPIVMGSCQLYNCFIRICRPANDNPVTVCNLVVGQ